MCSIFAIRNSVGNCLVGRNFDWIQKGGSIHFFPPYRSYGIYTKGFCLIEQMGVDRPYEGMNTVGLFVAMAAVYSESSCSAPKDQSTIMNDLGVMRFILERAESAQEALSIIDKFALDYMQSEGFPRVHYLFADNQFNVIVYAENDHPEIKQLSEREWMAITNSPASDKMACPRYQILNTRLSAGHVQNENDVKDLLQSVKQDDLTVWSSVYNLSRKQFQIYLEQNYSLPYLFDLEAELRKGQTSLDFGTLKLQLMLAQQKAG